MSADQLAACEEICPAWVSLIATESKPESVPYALGELHLSVNSKYKRERSPYNTQAGLLVEMILILSFHPS